VVYVPLNFYREAGTYKTATSIRHCFCICRLEFMTKVENLIGQLLLHS